LEEEGHSNIAHVATQANPGCGYRHGRVCPGSAKIKSTEDYRIDISEGMLEIGRKKILTKNLNSKIELVRGDSENIPFEENKFDAVTVAFGVRNFENLKRGLSEILRVLKPGGMVVVLEFSKPSKFPFKQVYNFYFRFILPKIGSIVSNDKAAYTYLPKSVEAFPDGEDFLHILHDVGFKNTQCSSLTFGISSIYIGTK
jgi:demethylmenaquinone methyltransferase/2-methoxy-6-polyprenyl-1,4-benzoquinol methylase